MGHAGNQPKGSFRVRVSPTTQKPGVAGPRDVAPARYLAAKLSTPTPIPNFLLGRLGRLWDGSGTGQNAKTLGKMRFGTVGRVKGGGYPPDTPTTILLPL